MVFFSLDKQKIEVDDDHPCRNSRGVYLSAKDVDADEPIEIFFLNKWTMARRFLKKRHRFEVSFCQNYGEADEIAATGVITRVISAGLLAKSHVEDIDKDSVMIVRIKE